MNTGMVYLNVVIGMRNVVMMFTNMGVGSQLRHHKMSVGGCTEEVLR